MRTYESQDGGVVLYLIRVRFGLGWHAQMSAGLLRVRPARRVVPAGSGSVDSRQSGPQASWKSESIPVRVSDRSWQQVVENTSDLASFEATG